ncbi:hypothetical protein COU78_06610 [Candidatus Peregrinibacteria bacterium CG10_big_fil_rev_8_21_14_0_10_49_24]|nr:MAG: hypothetical protein COU78_06610 [Candidatus Peregrinibacteria bacterium CG10_big_fil_rev_8_21_14_0_10_49_24]PJA67809.1 MAG: hypothetical protein CO157_02215 [Candidatus Peregrinibacteria bacterium CG_4_9_14_3_um_filter_49_12]
MLLFPEADNAKLKTAAASKVEEEVGQEADAEEKPLTGRGGVAQLLANMDAMDSFTIAREFTRLGLQHENNLFPELGLLMRQRREGFLILLNLVRLGKIRTDPQRQAIAEEAFRAAHGNGTSELQLAEAVGKLKIGLQGRKYRKMNGLITAFQNTAGEFDSFIQAAKGYWREVLPSLVNGEASSYEEARRMYGEKHAGSLRKAYEERKA